MWSFSLQDVFGDLWKLITTTMWIIHYVPNRLSMIRCAFRSLNWRFNHCAEYAYNDFALYQIIINHHVCYATLIFLFKINTISLVLQYLIVIFIRKFYGFLYRYYVLSPKFKFSKYVLKRLFQFYIKPFPNTLYQIKFIYSSNFMLLFLGSL